MTSSRINKQDTDKEQYALDSNVFRNLGFINLLREVKTRYKFVLPTIVTLEVGFYFRVKGINWEDFLGEIQKFGGVCLEWGSIVIQDVIKTAASNKIALPFRTHFRDFLIGSQCEKVQANLITENKRHFEWCKTITLLSPSEFTRIL